MMNSVRQRQGLKVLDWELIQSGPISRVSGVVTNGTGRNMAVATVEFRAYRDERQSGCLGLAHAITYFQPLFSNSWGMAVI